MSQEAVALDAGLNRGYYSGVERGVRNVSLANMGKIAIALGAPLSDVFSRTERVLGRSAT